MRGSTARLAALLGALLTLLLLVAPRASAAPAAPPAAGCRAGTYVADSPAPADPDDLKGCIDWLEGTTMDPNTVSVDIVLTDRTTGLPPAVPYGVFLTAHRPGGDAGQNPSPCQEPHFYTNPEYARGVYRCSWIVTGPGEWEFVATVNKVGAGVVGVQHLLTVRQTFDIADAVESKGGQGLRYVVEGSRFEVFLLQAHVAAASVWLLMVTAMAFLALRPLRRLCSVRTLHALEGRRHFLVSVLWAMFGCVIGTGVYLLRTQTAYEAPFSPSAWENITKLPYASTYFIALYLKIGLFVVMAAASVLLVQEAARQARLAGDAPAGGGAEDGDAFWDRSFAVPAEGAVPTDGAGPADGAVPADGAGPADGAAPVAGAVAVAPRPREDTGVSPRALCAAVFVIAGGMGAIGVCVTVVKYTHELVEMLVAAKTVYGK